MSELALQPSPISGLTIKYLAGDVDGEFADKLLADNVLALISFGSDAASNDPRHLRVPLEPLYGQGLHEVWLCDGPVQSARSGNVRYSESATHLFAVLEIDERQHDDIRAAARSGYAELAEFQRQSSKPHLQRIWNYFDAITVGDGDEERYQRFCVGRAEGLGTHQLASLPAATAIGRRDGSPILQIYWLAATTPGQSLENPRQISAYHYPRQYGPVAPRFARATLTTDAALLISGTASVVGHATHHDGDVHAQLLETLRNLDALLQSAHTINQQCPSAFGADALLKVYLRNRADADVVIDELRLRLPAGLPILILEADVCRSDLLIEIDGLHR